MVRMQVQLEPTQLEALRRLSAERNQSIAELVREGVDEVLNQGGRDSLRQRALKAGGKFSSGVSDVSKEHDTYLAADFR